MAVITSSEVINTGYAVLALIADAMVFLVLIYFLASRSSPSARKRWARFRDAVTPFALQIAWIVAVLATFGSLFLQYEEGLQPCTFCWFQRICMYPLSLLLGIAAFRGDVQVAKRYFLGLAMVGAVIAIYHYQLEHVPNEFSVCSLVPRRGSVQRGGHQYLRLHLRPLPVDGRVSAHHDADPGRARQARRLRG